SGASLQLLDDAAERVAAVLEVPELVEARRRRREQDDVTRLRDLRRMRDRSSQVSVAGVPATGCIERGGELFACGADEVDRADVLGEVGRERGEVLALERAAEDEVQRRVVRGDAATSGGGVRRLRIVDIADAAQLAHELEPVRDAGERAQRVRD